MDELNKMCGPSKIFEDIRKDAYIILLLDSILSVLKHKHQLNSQFFFQIKADSLLVPNKIKYGDRIAW